MRNELQTVLASLGRMAPSEMPALLGELEVIRATALLKMTTSGPPEQHDELLSVGEAAARLKVGVDYLYRHTASLPFTRRLGRKLLFSSRGIDAYLAKRR